MVDAAFSISSRRALLAGSGALWAGAAFTATGARAVDANPDAELIRLCEEFTAVTKRIYGLNQGPESADADAERERLQAPLYHRLETLAATIFEDHTAQTLQGFKMQARAIATYEDSDFERLCGEGVNGVLTAALIRDLVGEG